MASYFARISLASLLFLLAVAPVKASPAQIPTVPAVITTYDVYVGGVHLITADILFQEEKHKYHTHIQTRSYGLWHDLFPWDATLDASGRIHKDRFIPSNYSDLDIWKKRPKMVRIVFDAKGNPIPSFDPPDHDENREIVTNAQKQGSLDPITGLLQMLANVAMHKSCNVTVPLFDGKRRFDVTGIDDGTDDIDEADYNTYKGSARLCKADFKMISGEWKDHGKAGFWKLNDKENGREPFHIWLAAIAPNLPEMPVRLQSGSIWGLIIVHLTSWRYASPADLQAH